MTSKDKHFIRRTFRTPEWQAFKRECDITGDPSAAIAEHLEKLDQSTQRRFIEYAKYQRELHIRLLTQPTTA